MRPTFAIIAFTVLSGAGYGIWFVLGVGLLPFTPFSAVAPAQTTGAMSLSLCAYPALTMYLEIAGFVLVTAGLLCSLGHLGRPSRAWRALSQWRTSWLSREGVASIATYVPAIALVALPFIASLQTRGLSPTDSLTPWLDETWWSRILGFALAIGCAHTAAPSRRYCRCPSPEDEICWRGIDLPLHDMQISDMHLRDNGTVQEVGKNQQGGTQWQIMRTPAL